MRYLGDSNSGIYISFHIPMLHALNKFLESIIVIRKVNPDHNVVIWTNCFDHSLILHSILSFFVILCVLLEILIFDSINQTPKSRAWSNSIDMVLVTHAQPIQWPFFAPSMTVAYFRNIWISPLHAFIFMLMPYGYAWICLAVYN